MNLKFVWQSFTDYHKWALALALIVVAGMTGVSFLLGLSVLVLVGVTISYLEPLRASLGPARSYYRAARLGRKGRFRECLETTASYLEGHPRDGRAYELRALALTGLGRHEEALSDADRGVSWKRRWQGLMIRGQNLLFLACPSAALEDLEASYKIRAHPYTRMLMGQVFASLRRMDTATNILERSTRSVRFSLTFASLADCYRLLGDHDRAQKTYREAAKKARREVSSGMPCASVLAYCLAQLLHDEEAAAAINAALERDSRDALAHRTEALLSLRRGDVDVVETTIRQMLLISPQSAVSTLFDPQFTPLLRENRFGLLLAWSLGAQRQIVERVLNRRGAQGISAADST